MRVLRVRGPANCRVEDITTEAGTAKGNFYRYFPTWDDLLSEVRAHLLQSYAEQFLRRYEDRASVDWWAALDEEVDRFVEFRLELGSLHDVAFHDSSEATPALKHRSASSMVAWFLSEGIAAGSFAEVDVESTASLVFHLLHAAADEIALGSDQEKMRQAVLNLLHRALEQRSDSKLPKSDRHKKVGQ